MLTFSVEDLFCVVVRDDNHIGTLRAQSVEALLLYAILEELKALRPTETVNYYHMDQSAEAT